MQHSDQIYAYSTVLLAAAPLATQLATANIRWVFFFPIFAVPALTLMITVGTLSKSPAVQTFRKIMPIAGGIGWAFTWHMAEKLYTESLRASQLFMYILFSIRTSLSWAVSCDHYYNSQYCHDFSDLNISVTGNKTHHYPDNFWPAQEFNRYVIRDNPTITKMPLSWEPNMWYLGDSDEEFYFSLPSLHLFAAHIFTWSIIYLILVKYYDHLGKILQNVFVLLPLFLYIAVAAGLTVFGFHFTSASVQKELDDKKINEDPYDFWADLRGGFRTSILIVDYSFAFTGITLFATSRLRSGVGGLSGLNLAMLMMIVPAIQTIIRAGCEGHVSDEQPNYSIYASTDETISFDLLPVCFATSSLGPLWSGFYFMAQYLYSSLGPMVVYSAFIYHSFIDDFPTIQNQPKKWIGAFCLVFTALSVFLYMPLGTKIAAFLRYSSQTSFVQIAAYIVVFFIYGWKRLEHDIYLTVPSPPKLSVLDFLTSPINPIQTFLLFTLVPMLLCCKLVAVFDFLATGNDVATHIDAGIQFLPFSFWIRRLIGYSVMFAPVLIIIIEAARTIYVMMIKYHLSFSETTKPTADWMAHVSVNTNKPHYRSLAYVFFNRILKVRFRNAILALFIFETVVGILLVTLFFLNSVSLLGLSSSRIGNDYRSCMLLIFVILHTYALFLMRRGQQSRVIGGNLGTYICVATLETAMLNAYMWMFASDHKWGIDLPPFFIMIGNTGIRGFCILTAIAAKIHEEQNHRPSNTREASEVDDSEIRQADADEDDSPVIFDISNA